MPHCKRTDVVVALANTPLQPDKILLFHKTLSHTLTTDRGTVAVLFGLLLLPVLGVIGLSVDVMRLHQTRSDLYFALETAMQAGLRARTAQESTAKMRSYFETNWLASGHELPQDNTLQISIAPNEQNTLLIGKASYTLPTLFMQLFGHSSVTLGAHIEIKLHPR